ncbi:hypothetical protein JCM8097_001117 [Rhodosporidiobolus ruineniae]
MHFLPTLLALGSFALSSVAAAPNPNPDPAWYLAPTTTATTVVPHRSTFQERQSASLAAASSSSVAAAASSSAAAATSPVRGYYFSGKSYKINTQRSETSTYTRTIGPTRTSVPATTATPSRNPLVAVPNLPGNGDSWEVVNSYFDPLPFDACPGQSRSSTRISEDYALLSPAFYESHGGLSHFCGAKVTLMPLSGGSVTLPVIGGCTADNCPESGVAWVQANNDKYTKYALTFVFPEVDF